jgi:hypothetical protein
MTDEIYQLNTYIKRINLISEFTMKYIFVSLLLLSQTVFAANQKALPKNDAVAKIVAAIGTEWRDGNISTGTTEIYAIKWNSDANQYYEDDTKELFLDLVDENIQNARISKTDFESIDVVSDGVEKAAKDFMLSNAYSPDQKTFSNTVGKIYAILKTLSNSDYRNLSTTRYSAVLTNDGEKRQVSMVVFSSSNKKAVVFFFVEGTM